MDYLKMDAFILVSIINTKLRNNYSSLDQLCDDLGLDKEELCVKLNKSNFVYDEKTNQFK